MMTHADASQDGSRRLRCLIEGESTVFSVTVGRDNIIADLKKAIQSERALDALKDVGPHMLELWKVDIDLETHSIDFLSQLKPANHEAYEVLNPWTSVLQHWTDQPPLDHLHIIVKAPDAAFISADLPLSNNNRRLIARLRELHNHFWGKNQIVDRAEMACQILDLEPFRVFGLNPRNRRGDKILLIRNDYVSAYNYILTQTLTVPIRPSATLVTGQPGIGKTLFLFYVLARRLHEQGSVAFQIDDYKYCFFDQHGVTLKSTTDSDVPVGTWALSDTESGDRKGRKGLCYAFIRPEFHIIHTNSQSSSHWERWVNDLGANTYIMDVWGLEELQTLLALRSLDFAAGKCLFEKYGPSPGIILDILTNDLKENMYEEQVKTAAHRLATKFSTVFYELDNLNFGDGFSSMVITIRPKKTDEEPDSYTLETPTPFLCRTFALAISRLAAAQQDAFFSMLSTFPSFSDSAGLFEEYAHNHRLSEPKHKPLLEAYSLNGSVHIPLPTKMIAGSTALKRIQPPHNFFWRPLKPNFKGIDAIIRFKDNVWALQYTTSGEHKSATDGLLKIRNWMNHKANVKWHLVMVGSELKSAMKARDNQKLGKKWKWTTDVYAMGRFGEHHWHVKDLDTILNKYKQANDRDQRPDSDEVMDESL